MVFEREYRMAQMSRFGWSISHPHRIHRLERSALHRKLKALGIYLGPYRLAAFDGSSSRQKPRVSCAARSERLNSTHSSSAAR
jgi:hypothetical protein